MSILQKQNPAGGRGFAGTTGQVTPPNHNPIELLLSRLEGVRNAGKGYRARCPACGGKSTKVSISEGDDGRVLLHAFCGCSPAQVLEAVGLSLADLFPTRLGPMSDADRRQARQRAREAGLYAAIDVLAVEATVIQIAGRQLARWKFLSVEDDQRLAEAVTRVDGARMVLRGR